MLKMKILLFFLLLNVMLCFHFHKHNVHNKTKCVFYIVKGCKISLMKYLDLKKQIKWRKLHNQTLYDRDYDHNIMNLPECNGKNFNPNLHEPFYVLKDNKRAKVISEMVGLFNSSNTIDIINGYKKMFKEMCLSDLQNKKITFVNFLKISFCNFYNSFGKNNSTNKMNFIEEAITKYRKKYDIKTNIKNINDSLIFNTNWIPKRNKSHSFSNLIFPKSSKVWNDLKDGFYKHPKTSGFLNGIHSIYSGKFKIEGLSVGQHFIQNFKKNSGFSFSKINAHRKNLYNVMSMLPHGIYNSKEVKTKAIDFINEIYFLKNEIGDHLNNMWKSLKIGHKKYHKIFGKTKEYKEMSSFHKFPHMIKSINSFYLKRQKHHQKIRYMKYYNYKERILSYDDKRWKYNWKNPIHDHHNLRINTQMHSIQKWSGFTSQDNEFDLTSLADWFNGTLWLGSYIFNPFLKRFNKTNPIFNEDNCTPEPPLLPNPSDGCIFPKFIGPALNNTIFPEGFDISNPKCEDYNTIFTRSYGVLQIPGTLIFGPLQVRFPFVTPVYEIFGIDLFINNATGKQGLAALPPNLIVCLSVNALWFGFFAAWLLVIALMLIFFLLIGVFAIARRLYAARNERAKERVIYHEQINEANFRGLKKKLQSEIDDEKDKNPFTKEISFKEAIPTNIMRYMENENRELKEEMKRMREKIEIMSQIKFEK